MSASKITPRIPPLATNGAESTTPRPNGLTDEQVKELLAAAGRRKNDTDYLKQWDEGIAEYRQRIQEELERELSEETSK
jgi:hypothetical protein